MRPDALEPVHLPDEVWRQPATVRALRERRIGYLFDLAKKYAGASQTRIANVAGMDQSEVSRIRKGDRQVTAIDVLERIAEGFGMPSEARMIMGLAPKTSDYSGIASDLLGESTLVPEESHEVMRRRTALYGMLAGTGLSLTGSLLTTIDAVRQTMDHTLGGSNITSAQMDQIEETTQRHGRYCVYMPPMEMLCQLVLDFVDIQQLLIQSQNLAIQLRLYRVAAQIATLAADELTVIGSTRQSWAWHNTAKTLADETGDPQLRAQVRSLGALLPLYYGDPGEAVSIARQAQAMPHKTPDAAQTLAATLEAFALAQLGDTATSSQGLDSASILFEKLHPEWQIQSVFGFSERRWRFYESRTLAKIGDFRRSWESQEKALALYPVEVIGDPTLIKLDRAISLVSNKEISEGCHLASHVLRDMPPEHRTDIFLNHGRKVLRSVPQKQRNDSPVNEYRDLLAELTGSMKS